jgi:hypothetical protein
MRLRRRTPRWRPPPELPYLARARVHVYAVCWNDMPMLPYFLRHYRCLDARFLLFDDGSTDGSLEYLRAQHDVEVAPFERDGRSFELSALALYDEVWKRSRDRADWVVMCDVDEHVHHADLAGYLDRSKHEGVTAIEAVGYQMVTDSFPETERRLCDDFVHGARWEQMDKLAIFDPSAIRAINYVAGRHAARPKGRVVFPPVREVKLLHYRYLGLEYVRRRNSELGPRLGPVDLKKNFGHKYRWDDETLRADFEGFASAAEPVV